MMDELSPEMAKNVRGEERGVKSENDEIILHMTDCSHLWTSWLGYMGGDDDGLLPTSSSLVLYFAFSSSPLYTLS